MTIGRVKTVRLGVLDPSHGTGGHLFAPSSAPPAGSPILCGPGKLDQICGRCDRVLIHGLQLGQVRKVVLRCPGCGTHNSTDPAKHGTDGAALNRRPALFSFECGGY